MVLVLFCDEHTFLTELPDKIVHLVGTGVWPSPSEGEDQSVRTEWPIGSYCSVKTNEVGVEWPVRSYFVLLREGKDEVK